LKSFFALIFILIFRFICLWNSYAFNNHPTLLAPRNEPARLQKFLLHLNSIRPTIKFTVEVKANDTLPFLDVLVMKRGPKRATKVYWKCTHASHYLYFKSNHPHHVKTQQKNAWIAFP
jgi:hypothetical protein